MEIKNSEKGWEREKESTTEASSRPVHNSTSVSRPYVP